MSRSALSRLSLLILAATGITAAAQQSPQPPQTLPPAHDPQALTVLQQSFAAMGGALPADSVATGTVTIVEGSLNESGSIRILMRGTTQTVENIQAGNDQRIVVFSGIAAAETRGGVTKSLYVEGSSTSQCPDFPLQLVAWALNNSDASMSYVGLESVNDHPAHHIRVWNSFTSIPALQKLAEFSLRDMWIDSTTLLPLKLTYQKRDAGGSSPRIPMEIDYSNYQNVGGALFPFQISKIFNGTPWTTITVSSVTLNNGLTDSDFPMPAGSNQ